MYEVNRSIAIVKPKLAFFDWLRGTPDWDLELTLENLRVDCTALLIPEFNEPEDAINFIDDMYQDIFDSELASWCDDTALWPQQRTLQTFWEWFDIELHSMVIDVTDDDIDEVSLEDLH